MNAAFFASQIETWKTAFQNCSHTYPIDKDMSLIFWLIWISQFLFLFFFHWNSLVKVSHSAACNMTNILQAFIISDLWNNSKAWDNFQPRWFIKSFTYFEKPSGVFRKSGFSHIVGNFRVAGKYWWGCRSFNFFTWIWRLQQVYLTCIKVIN